MEPFRNSSERVVGMARDPPPDISHESDWRNVAGSFAWLFAREADAIHRRPGVPPNLITLEEQR